MKALSCRQAVSLAVTLLLMLTMASAAMAQRVERNPNPGNNTYNSNSGKKFPQPSPAYDKIDTDTNDNTQGTGPVGKGGMGNDKPKLDSVTVTRFQIPELMGKGEQCMGYDWQDDGALCCQVCEDELGRPKCCDNAMANQYSMAYWEPSAIVEVSCRSGYSMLTPGQIPTRGNIMAQSCQGYNKPGNSRWYFEARVWAINGYDGGIRHQAMGGTNGERARQCSEVGDDTLRTNYWAYGQKKWDEFDHSGSGSGPGGSWEAYISDKDETWAKDLGVSGQGAPGIAQCTAGKEDVNACWGPVNENGWVSHPNPTVAAALVALRAHTKAVNSKKVSPDLGAGFKMAMDFPFPTYSGAFASSQGRQGNDKTGSDCFKPGNPGPDWFGGQTPEQSPDFIKKLKLGDVKITSEMNSGIYVFTFWVKTNCVRYTISGKQPVGICRYVDLSPQGSHGGAPAPVTTMIGHGDLGKYPPVQPPAKARAKN